MKLFKISFSNMRKGKSSAITFFAIVIMSALMLSISLSLILNMGSFYDKKREELNTPHLTVAIFGGMWQDSMLGYAENYEGVKDVEQTDGYMLNVKYNSGDSILKQQFFIYDENIQKTMNTFKIIDKLSTKPSDSIILTLNFKYSGFKAGDKFSFSFLENAYSFTIYGFFEDAEIGSSTTNIKSAYINAESYERISLDPNALKIDVISLFFDKMETSYDFQTDFLNYYNLGADYTFSATYEMTKMAATMFPLIMSLMLILVASIILLIAFMVVRFTIKNNIEEDIKSLGALKSIGYTSKQIVLSIIIQFFIISFLGGIAGAALGAVAMGYIGNVVSATSGLLWSGAGFFVPALISVLFIIGLTLLVTFFAAKKSKKITPINALRQGMSNHTFKKNYAPFEKTKMPLNFAVAVKSFFYNIKNNITAFLVLFMFAFVAIVGYTLYHNFVVDSTAFKQMIGTEFAQIQFLVNEDELVSEYFSEVKAMDGVERTLEYNLISMTSDNKLLSICVWDDISKKDTASLIKGRYPVNDNEISLTSVMQKTLKKNIGDVIDIEYEGVIKSYLITGITQGIGNTSSDFTKEGLARLKEGVILRNMYIFLTNSDSDYIDNFVDALMIKYGSTVSAVNFQEAIDSTIIALKGPISIATILVSALTLFNVCFVFFLLISTIIRRRKKDFGIMKALGFTSGQIIIQMLLSFLPVIILSTTLGTVAGVFLTKPVLGLMFSGIGVAKPLFVVPLGLTVLSEILLVGISVLTVCLMSLKTKNISPQKLIVEQ